MAKQVQFRRGTAAQHTTFTGVAGEITVDTDDNRAVVHDGSTVGGHGLAKEVELPPTGNLLSAAEKQQFKYILARERTPIHDIPRIVHPQPAYEAIVVLQPFGATTAVAVGDGAGQVYFTVPAKLNGWSIVDIEGSHVTPSATGGTNTTTNIMLRRVRVVAASTASTADITSTVLSIDEGEYNSKDAAAAHAFTATNVVCNEGDMWFVDVDQIAHASGTPALGLGVMVMVEDKP